MEAETRSQGVPEPVRNPSSDSYSDPSGRGRDVPAVGSGVEAPPGGLAAAVEPSSEFEAGPAGPDRRRLFAGGDDGRWGTGRWGTFIAK